MKTWKEGTYNKDFHEVLVLKDSSIADSLACHVMEEVLDTLDEINGLVYNVIEHIEKHPDSVIHTVPDIEGDICLRIDNNYDKNGSSVDGDKEYVEVLRKYDLDALGLKKLNTLDYKQSKLIYTIDFKSELDESDYELAKSSLQKAGIEVQDGEDLSKYADAVVLFDFLPTVVFEILTKYAIAYSLNEFYTHDIYAGFLGIKEKDWKFDGSHSNGTIQKNSTIKGFGVNDEDEDEDEDDILSFGVIVNEAAGRIWVAEIPNTADGISIAEGRHGSLVSQHATREEAEAEMQRLDGDRVHYVVYADDSRESANYIELVGEYNGTYQEICGAHNDFIKDCNTLEEAQALVAEIVD